MSSESLGAVGASSAFTEQRTPSALPNQSAPAPKQQEKLEQAALSPAEASEALADKALDAAQQAQQEQAQKNNADLSADELKDMLEEVNNLLYSMNRSLRFEVHDKTEDLIVRVVNTKTDEVIRQYPREEVIERREKLLQGELGAFSAQVE